MSSRSVITDVSLGPDPSILRWEGIGDGAPLDEAALAAMHEEYAGEGGNEDADGEEKEDADAETIRNLQSELTVVKKELASLKLTLQTYQAAVTAQKAAANAEQSATAALMQWQI